MVGPERGLPLPKTGGKRHCRSQAWTQRLCCDTKHPWFGAENLLDSFRFSSKKLPVSLPWEKWIAERWAPQRHCEGHCQNVTERVWGCVSLLCLHCYTGYGRKWPGSDGSRRRETGGNRSRVWGTTASLQKGVAVHTRYLQLPGSFLVSGWMQRGYLLFIPWRLEAFVSKFSLVRATGFCFMSALALIAWSSNVSREMSFLGGPLTGELGEN